MRRINYRLLVAFSLLLSLAATEVTARPRYGGTLRVEMREVVRSLDPAEWPADTLAAAAKEKLVSLIFEPLVRLDESGQPRSALAVSWQHDANFKQWRFRLRPEVRFDDGEPMTAERVATALRSAAEVWQVSAVADGLLIESDLPMPNLLFELTQASRSVFLRGDNGKLSGTGSFRLAQWDPGRRAVLAANEQYWAGRPFLDAVSIEMGRPLREQSLDLELGKADFVEIWPNEIRRAAQRGSRIWSSAPNILIALAFERGRAAAEDVRVREAVALSIDRAAMYSILLQKQGEPAAALLPQQLSGYAFLFSAAPDAKKARQAVSGLGPSLPPLALAYDSSDSLGRAMAERISLNAREAGITLQVSGLLSNADLRLVRLPIRSPLPAPALSQILAFFRLADLWQSPGAATPEALYASEHTVVDSYRIIPLFHISETFGSNPRLRAWTSPGVLRSGVWRFDDLWMDVERP